MQRRYNIMKKLLSCLILFLAVMLMTTVALAEGELPTDPFTWEQLATIAGATVAVLLIVQLLKLPIDKVWKIPTRIVAYVIALTVMLVATYFTVGLTWSEAGLAAVNAVIVALAAMGAYEVTFRKLEAGKQKEDPVEQ
jgi:hypothetical protein